MVTTPLIRYHGGKFRLAPWVISHFPAHRYYIEPFGGAAGVLLRKPRCYAEVYNDLDDEMVNLLRVIRDPQSREALIEQLVLTPYARVEFEAAWQPASDPIEQARRTIIRAQMGFGSSGATKKTTGFRVEAFRDYGTPMQLWAQYPDSLATIGQRLATVMIEHRDAIECMQQHDHPDALHYVDPPYLFATRKMKNGGHCYRHEMSDEQHQLLLATLRELRGMVILSGYPNNIYQLELENHGWARHETTARISAGRGTAIRTECLWMNPAATNTLHGAGLPMEQTA